MAKEDFCFTYYDGDAARDMAHMTRLERGCYTDVIISIRKFGHITIDQIKKILSRDYEECFPAIELILKKDQEGKYFIEWLENSLEKSKKHSKKQRDNRFGKTKPQPNDNQTTVLVAPLEDGYGDVFVLEDNNTEKEVEEKFLVPQMLQTFLLTNKNYKSDPQRDYPELFKIATFYKVNDIGIEALLQQWKKICDFIAAHSLYRNYNLLQVNRYIQSIDTELTNGTKQSNKSGQAGNNGKSAGAISIANALVSSLGITGTGG